MEKQVINIMLSDLKQEKQRDILERMPKEAASEAKLGTIPLFMLAVKEDTGEVKTYADGGIVADTYPNQYFTQDVRMNNYFVITIPGNSNTGYTGGYWSDKLNIAVTSRNLITWYDSYDEAIKAAKKIAKHIYWEIKGYDKKLL